MSAYLPGQASYLAVLRQFESGEIPPPSSGASFPSWLSPDGQLTIQLPVVPSTPALETRVADLRSRHLRWAARSHLLTVKGKEGWARLRSCPPCGRPLQGYAPFCKQRLCPFCYGREHVEYFYRNVAALAELLWSEGKPVYAALDAAQVPFRPDGSLPAWKPAEARDPLGGDVDNQPRGLIEAFQPLPSCTADDRRSFEGGVRVFCPLPPVGSLDGARPFLNVRWLRVHSAQPSPLLPPVPQTGTRPHLAREIERLSDLIPLVAATCEFPAWMLDPKASSGAVSQILRWSRGHQYRASYGALAPKSLGPKLFDHLGGSGDRIRAVKLAFFARYNTISGRPLADVRRTVDDLARKHGVLPGVASYAASRGYVESAPAFPEMGEEVESARVFRGPDGQLYVVMPAQSAAPLDTLS